MAATIQTIQKPTKARALDTSGNNNHGQIYSGRALEFDGVSDYLTSNNMDMSGGDTLTICTWVYSNTTGSGDEAIVNQEGNFRLIRTAANELTFTVATSNNAWYNVTIASSDLQDNSWNRIIALYDGSNMKIYINGTLSVTSSSITGNILNTSAKTFDIGRTTLTSNLWNGNLCDLQLWNAAFTAEDVTYDYLNPEQLALNRGGTSLTNSNLKAWYPMNDGHRGQQSYILDASNTGLSDNLVVDGNFPSSDNWTLGNGMSINNNLLSVDGTQTDYTYAYQQDTTNFVDPDLIPGTWKIVFTIDSYTDGSVSVGMGGYNFSSTFESTGTHTVYIKPTNASSNSRVYFKCNANFVGSFSNIEVYRVNDKNHATTVFYGDEQISATNDRTFAGASNWANRGGSNAWDTYNESAASGADESTALTNYAGETVTFTDNYLNLAVTSDGSNNKGAYLDGANWEDADGDGPAMVVGRTYRLSYSVQVSAYTSGTLSIGLANASHAMDTDNDKLYAGLRTAYADYIDFVYEGTTNHAEILINASTSSAFTAWFDNFSIREVGAATGWTDADQQLDIPQTALQSYNQLAWFSDVESSGITISDHSDFSFGDGSDDTPFSVSAWIYLNEAGVQNGIVSKDSSSQREWAFVVTANNNLRFWVVDGNTTSGHAYQSRASGTIMDDYVGKWCHVVGTYNGVGGNDAANGLKVYLNGEQVDTTDINGGTGDDYVAMENGTADIVIGDNPVNANYELGGSVTEVSIWGTELSQTEINELYNDGEALDATTHSEKTNLKGYWRNNGLSTWTNIHNLGTHDGSPTGLTETMLITAGVDSSRDSQGFLMNRQRLTNSLNLPYVEPTGIVNGEGYYTSVPGFNFHATTMSISLWLKTPSCDTDNTILDKYLTSGNMRALRLYLHGTNELTFQLSSNGSNNESQLTTNASLANDTWYHIAITYSSGTWLVYKNGSSVSLDAAAFSTTTSIEQNTQALRIGHSSDTKEPWDGEIDDLLIYEKVLTADEVKRNYNAGKRSHK